MLISEDIRRISEMMGVNPINRPDLKSEMDEIQRVTQYLNRDEGLHVTVNELVDVFDKSKEVTLNKDIWDELENTESNDVEKGDMDKVNKIADTYDKSNPSKLKNSFEDGSYKRPLILKFNNRYHLVAGNTRLCTAAAMGIQPKVFIGELTDSDQTDTNNKTNN